MKKRDISFVITTYRSENTIFNCLDTLPDEVNKIIIENSNNSQLKHELEKKYKNLTCYVMRENLGYGKANNFGIDKSETNFVFILNPDACLLDDTLSELERVLSDIDFSIAAPVQVEKKNEIDFNKNKFIEVDFVKGFAMILNKKKIGNIFFDENFFLYLEEIDLCKRVKDKGGKILIVDTSVNHVGGLSHGKREDIEMEKSRNWHWMWSKFYYNKKHYGYIYGLIKTFPNFFTAFFKVIFYSITKNQIKKDIYKMRILGLVRSYILKDSNYRPYKSNS